MVDRDYLSKVLPSYASLAKPVPKPIKIRGIGEAIMTSSQYIRLDFRIAGTLDNSPATALFSRDVHIVDHLSAMVLIGMDIIGPENMTMTASKLTIGSCKDLVAKLTSKPKGIEVKRNVRSKNQIMIPAHTTMIIPVDIAGKSNLSVTRDYMFHPCNDTRYGSEGGILSHVVDANMSVVQVNNASDKNVMIYRRSKLGMVREIQEEGCFLTIPAYAHLAAGSFAKKGLKLMTAALAVSNVTNMETITANGITIYRDSASQTELASVAESYPSLWTDDGSTVAVPPEQWMPIPIKQGAKVDAAKVYPVGPKDREFIDEVFNKLHSQGRMEYTTKPTPHSYPVFVVWRTLLKPGQPPMRKGRVVVDIRGLNKITDSDSYPMPLQADITSAVSGCNFISVFDPTSFFYQWLVRLEDRHKLTVVSHRGQEQFNVAVMGYKNSPPYVQRQIDNVLRDFREFARAYIDDIVVYSRTLQEYLDHLRKIFGLFSRLNISLNPKKSYLGYPTIQLLGQPLLASRRLRKSLRLSRS